MLRGCDVSTLEEDGGSPEEIAGSIVVLWYVRVVKIESADPHVPT